MERATEPTCPTEKVNEPDTGWESADTTLHNTKIRAGVVGVTHSDHDPPTVTPRMGDLSEINAVAICSEHLDTPGPGHHRLIEYQLNRMRSQARGQHLPRGRCTGLQHRMRRRGRGEAKQQKTGKQDGATRVATKPQSPRATIATHPPTRREPEPFP